LYFSKSAPFEAFGFSPLPSSFSSSPSLVSLTSSFFSTGFPAFFAASSSSI
jgi:hypothetical protein